MNTHKLFNAFMIVVMMAMAVGVPVTASARTASFAPSLEDGLVAYYPFNGNADDGSGNGLNGVIYGATLTEDRFGNSNSAYSFDGVDDYASLGNPTVLAFVDAVSISAWIKPTLEGTWGHPILSKRAGPYDRSYDLMIYNNGQATWGYANSGHQNLDVYDSIIPVTWQHIVAVYFWDGTNANLRLYLNGVKIGETTKNAQMLANESIEIAIGTLGSQGEYFFNGAIDEVRIYDRTLTESEIQELYLGSAPPAPTKVGLVTDVGGVNDMAFNWMANQGLLQAETDLGIDGTLYESVISDDYVPLLQQCADDGNELCIAVGFMMGDAVSSAANANPGVKFAILDFSPDSPPDNLRGIRFDEKQSGYLAGALAGLMTTSDIIGAVGGMEIQPVVDFAEGYRNGAQCANPDVNVLINYTGTFTDPDLGATTAQNMIAEGADVIFGAAGATGNGAILYSSQHDLWSIGVDTDQYLTVFGDGTVDGSDKLLTSAMKNLDFAVYQTIEDYLNGSFSSGMVTYRLADGGVGLAPYHETDASIPQSTKDYVDGVKADIINESIDINATCRPEPPLNPTFTVWLNQNKVDGYGWPENTQVTLTVGDPASPEIQVTETVGNADLGSQGIRFQFGDEFELLNGQLITLSDTTGAYTKSHTITDLIVTDISADANTVTGTAAVGSDVGIYNKWDDQIWRHEITVSDGSWTADFHIAGDEPGEVIADIKPGEEYHVCQSVQDGSTCWYLPIPNPSIGVRVNDDKVEGWQWPLGATVTVTVDDPDTPAEPDITRTAVVYEASWNPGEYRFDLNLSGAIDIQPGFEVTAAEGGITKMHIVTSLEFTDINVDLDLVTGVAGPGSRVDIWACDDFGCTNRHVNAGSGGIWTADFANFGDEDDEQNTFNIVPGTWIDSSQGDDDGDNTMFGQHVPDPRMDVSYEHDWIQINDFTPGGEVTYTIYDHQGGHALFGPVTGPVDSHGNGWISYNLFRTDLIPGNFVTAVDETTGEEVSLLIRNANLDYIEADDDRAFGTAEPNTTIQLNISETHDSGFNLTVPVDGSGYWEVDLAAEGHPIDGYRHASANLYDAEGDAVIAQSPWIDAEISTDSFGVTNFSKNADVTFTLYDSPGGIILYDPVTLRTEGNGGAWVNLWDHGIDLVPGNYITAYDHTLGFTRSLEVEPFDFVEMNAAEDYVSGTAAVGEWVDLHVESLFSNWGMDALTDESGQWFRDYGAQNYDITEQMWANGWAVDDQGNRSHDHTTGLPGLEVSIADDWISGYNFSPNRQVRIRIYASEEGNLLAALGDPLADILVTAQGNTRFHVDYWQHGVDLQAGMYILAEDLETGKSSALNVIHLTFDGVDYDADTAWGTAEPFARVVVRASHLFDSYEITVDADEFGDWSANFSHYGADITSEWDLRAMIFDLEYDATVANAPQPPVFTASLNGDWVNGNNWTAANNVSIQVYEYEGGPSIAGPFTWGTDNYGNFNANLWNEGVDLLPGNYVTVTDNFSGVVKSLTLPNLTIDYLDPDLEVAGGLAPPDTRISVQFNNQQEGVQFDLFSESDGTWEADFAVYDFDLTPGSNGNVRIFDEDGDAVQVDGRVLAPYVEASPNSNWVHGRDWPLGTVLTMTISGSSETYTATVVHNPWNPGDPNDILADFDLQGYDVRAGDIITVTDGSISKTLTVSQLNVTGFDLDADTVSGTGTPGIQIQVCANVPNRCITRWVTPDGSGNWTANYHNPGTGNDDPDTFDVQTGSNGWAAEYEDDSDRTWYDWRVPAPNIGVRANDDKVEGWEWPLGATITVTVDDPGTPAQPDITRTAVVYDAPWNPGEYRFDLDVRNAIDIQPGFIVTATDGNVTKTHIVTSLAFTDIDIDLDLVTGMADPGSRVDVWVCGSSGPCINRHVDADGDGLWTADFAHVGDEGDEQVTFDIVLGTWIDSSERDEDGDSTMFGQRLPNPNIGVRANDDKVEGWEWALDATIMVTVDDPGTPAEPDITRTAVVYDAPWNPGEYRFDLDVRNAIDIQPGFVVTATDGNVTKTHIVTSLAFTNININLDLVTGMADPGSRVDVWACDATNCFNRHVNADQDGNWLADFAHVGDEGDEQNTFDIVIGTWVDSQQSDEDGDRTMFGLTLEAPQCQPGDTVTGNVFEHDGITPVKTANIQIFDYNSGEMLFVSQADDNGHFGCYLPEGEYRINASADSYSSEYFDEAVDVNAFRLEITAGTQLENINFTISPLPLVEHLTFNLQNSLLQELAVRQAIAFGTDRQRILDEAFKPNDIYGTVLNSIVPTEHWASAPASELVLYPFDPVQARAILEAAGWVDRDDDGFRENTEGVELSFTFKTSNTAFRMASGEIFRQNMEQIGIRINTEYLEPSILFGENGTLEQRDFDITEFAWAGGYDNEPYLSDYVSGSPANYASYSSLAYDTAIANARVGIGDAGKLPYLFEAQRILTQDLPILPFFTRYAGQAPRTPFIEAYPVDDEVVGANWPAESTVTLTIDDPATEDPSDYTASRVAHPWPYTDDMNTVVAFRLVGLFDIQPGYIVTLSDGITSKSVVVSDVSISAVDPDTETILGMAAPGSAVNFDACGPVGIADCIWQDEIADGSGQWSVDATAQGYDLQPGVSGSARQYDEDGDSTIIRFVVVTPLPPDFVPTDTVIVPAGDPIQIAAVLDLGPDSGWLGTDAVNAIQLAIEDFGPINGFSITQTSFDSDCNEDFLTAQAAALNVIANPDYVGVIGHACSRSYEAGLPLYEAAGLVSISGSSTKFDTPDFGPSVSNRVTVNDYYYESSLWLPIIQAMPSVQDWNARYQLRFDDSPAEYAVLYYDAAILLLKRLAQTSELQPDGSLLIDRTELASTVRATYNYEGVTGCFSLDGRGDRLPEEVDCNQPPHADAGPDLITDEGATLTLDASASSDPEEGPLTFAWDLDNDGEYDDAMGVTTEVTFPDNGEYTVGLQVTDETGLSDTDTITITVNNVSPRVTYIYAPVSPVKIGTIVNVNAGFDDPGMADTFTAKWNWDDGTTSDGAVTNHSVSGSHIYTTPGVYVLRLTVTDDDGGSGTSTYQYIVVYDPTGGFVTGGGWFIDPISGAKAHFGFNPKYQKDSTVPKGETEFKLDDLKFKSASHEWLVINEAKAQFKGTGTINGVAGYEFLVTVLDGSPDKIRIKIWNTETGQVIYDNQPGAPETADPTTAIGGGSIVIHKSK